jgi:hypothetical protein
MKNSRQYRNEQALKSSAVLLHKNTIKLNAHESVRKTKAELCQMQFIEYTHGFYAHLDGYNYWSITGLPLPMPSEFNFDQDYMQLVAII